VTGRTELASVAKLQTMPPDLDLDVDPGLDMDADAAKMNRISLNDTNARA